MLYVCCGRRFRTRPLPFGPSAYETDETTTSPFRNCTAFEREDGIEPSTELWQSPELPLHHTRKNVLYPCTDSNRENFSFWERRLCLFVHRGIVLQLGSLGTIRTFNIHPLEMTRLPIAPQGHYEESVRFELTKIFQSLLFSRQSVSTTHPTFQSRDDLSIVSHLTS